MYRAQKVPAADQGTRFVVLTSQRTGSTLLVRSLDKSTKILCAGEIFHPGHDIHHPEFRYPRELFGSSRLGQLRDVLVGRTRIRKHLNQFFLAAGSQVEAVGFKLMLSQQRQYPAIMPTLRELSVRFLFLYRDDSFATTLSYCRARATGVFHSDSAGDAPGRSPIEIREEEFVQILNICQTDKQQLIQLHRIHGGCLMRYEDMIENWDAFIESVGISLGISELRVPQALSKLDLDTNCARIANRDALLARFGSATRNPT